MAEWQVIIGLVLVSVVGFYAGYSIASDKYIHWVVFLTDKGSINLVKDPWFCGDRQEAMRYIRRITPTIENAHCWTVFRASLVAEGEIKKE